MYNNSSNPVTEQNKAGLEQSFSSIARWNTGSPMPADNKTPILIEARCGIRTGSLRLADARPASLQPARQTTAAAAPVPCGKFRSMRSPPRKSDSASL